MLRVQAVVRTGPAGNNMRDASSGSPENATNVYYPDTKSAIYLPRSSDRAPSELVELLETSPLSDLIRESSKNDAQRLRLHHPTTLNLFTDEQIEAALKIVCDENRKSKNFADKIEDYKNFEGDLLPLEYGSLKSEQDEPRLQVQLTDIQSFDESLRPFFSTNLPCQEIERDQGFGLGFPGFVPGSNLSLEQKKKMMFKQAPSKE